MNNKAVDFWGMTENIYPIPHLQSYFIVLKKAILVHPDFQKFITSIKHQPNKEAVIREYELGLTKCLKSCGFKYTTYFDNSIALKNKIYPIDLTLFHPFFLIKNGFPFLKKKIFEIPQKVQDNIFLWPFCIKQYLMYPIGLITNYLKNNYYQNKSVFLFFQKVSQKDKMQHSSALFFDPVYYCKTYPEVLNYKGLPRNHYDKIGWKKGYNASSLFNTEFYLNEHPDIRENSINPLIHFEKHCKSILNTKN